MRRNAETGVNRSATSSFTTGTKVLRCASSVNVSKEVCFIIVSLVRLRADSTERCLAHQSCGWPPAQPPLGLVFGLCHQHVEPAERLTARSRGFLQQPGLGWVVDQVVDHPAVERALERRLIDA